MGRVDNRYVWQGGQTENQGGQTKKFFRRFAPNFCPPWPETLPAPLIQCWVYPKYIFTYRKVERKYERCKCQSRSKNNVRSLVQYRAKLSWCLFDVNRSLFRRLIHCSSWSTEGKTQLFLCWKWLEDNFSHRLMILFIGSNLHVACRHCLLYRL